MSQGTVAEKAISRLFQGKMKSVIRCLKVQCESSRTEDFYDIQLNVKGCRNLNDSFMEYIKKETLEDDNKYYSSEHGFQDATKGVIFEYFPPILHLQLKRFEFDFNSNSMIKINDYYEFPLKFSIRDYLEDALQFKEGDLIYHLHGVLVHSGDLHCGHYCAFIRPGVENKWFKFDDERVSPASEKEALNQNYGESSQDNMDESMEINYSRLKREVMYAKNHKKYTNAYMLVYLKESERDELLEPLSIEEDVPEHLISSIERENTHLENLKKERIESSKFIDVRILTDEVIEKHYGHGIASTRGDQEPSDLCFIFKRENTIGSLREFVADKLDLNPEKFRLWVTSQRQMGQCRPDTLLTPKQDKDCVYRSVYFSSFTLKDINAHYPPFLDLHSICEMPKVFLQRQRTITIYLEKLSDDELNNGNHPNAINKKMLDSLKESNIILYLKFYDPSSKQVTYVGSAVVDKKAKVSDVVNILRDRRSLPSSSIIAVYEVCCHC